MNKCRYCLKERDCKFIAKITDEKKVNCCCTEFIIDETKALLKIDSLETQKNKLIIENMDLRVKVNEYENLKKSFVDILINDISKAMANWFGDKKG